MKRNLVRKKVILFLLLALFIAITTQKPCTADSKSAGKKKSMDAKMKKVTGIDVSHFSGSVDWGKVKAAGYSFAFAKVTEGVDYKDPMFAVNWPAIKKAGLIRGIYHFYVTEDDPKEQANFFIGNVTLEKGDLAPVVDIEVIGKDSKPGFISRFQTFLNILEKHYDIKPIIYTDCGFWNANMNDKFGSYPIWLAEYDVESPKLPEGWTSYHLWQWEGDAKVPGVEKSADISVLNSKMEISTLLLK
ncbi:MAG: glycoside hydrolase family 25 protein [Candidatus Aminicenantes bacterium]|nr:glycoside hydrolase family 25 protein [Candidatus Aminicenantes bacterium]